VSLGAVAPAVEDGEDNGFWHTRVRIARVRRRPRIFADRRGLKQSRRWDGDASLPSRG
jgi:hypothetical protein